MPGKRVLLSLNPRPKIAELNLNRVVKVDKGTARSWPPRMRGVCVSSYIDMFHFVIIHVVLC